MARHFCHNLPTGIHLDTVYESIRHIAGKEITTAGGLQLCWRIAGNIPRLKAGVPAAPWASQRDNEWIPLQILKATPSRNARGRRGYTYDFRVLAGSPCTMKITSFWNAELVRAMARKMGFSAPWHSYPFRHGVELVGLRLLGEVDRLRSQFAPAFYEVAVPQSFVQWNRRNVLRVRCRVDPCPRRYNHACRMCAVGYEECPAATHRQNYFQQFCVACGTENAWFDPDMSTERCMDCHAKDLARMSDI